MLTLFAFILVLNACYTVNHQLIEPADFRESIPEADHIKAHSTEGKLYVFESWKYDSHSETLTGSGKLYSADRELMASDSLGIEMNSVEILSIYNSEMSNAALVQVILAGTSAVFTIYCLTSSQCF